MNEQLVKEAERLADRDYTIIESIEPMQDGRILVSLRNPELVGCMAQGETFEEALVNLRDARVDYIYDSLVNNEPIPEPEQTKPTTMVPNTTTVNPSTNIPKVHLKVQKFTTVDVPSRPLLHEVHQYVDA